MSGNRTRSWRRFKNFINRSKGMGTEKDWRPEKNWKMVYLRSAKLARAKQLGFEYPRKNLLNIAKKALSSESE
ncbi:hypothetical protein [Pseudoalteromonas luteoviolacea]|uniref:hypothetical protein n=1 Tax=Pseudoalteromonas luteoviolacea TaxID=43657 RepID=UPI0007B04433|nr:hypothetical protein [Pseudoalteromonas luteoviolacea]